VKLQSRLRPIATGSWKRRSEALSHRDNACIGKENIANAVDADIVAYAALGRATQRNFQQRSKERLSFSELLCDRLRRDIFAGRYANLGGDVFISDDIALTKGDRGEQSLRLKFTPALKSSRSAGDFVDGFGGKKIRGESVASGRSYRWPPCQGSLWNGLFSRIHWEAIFIKSPDNLDIYNAKAAKSASDALLAALAFIYALGLMPLALS